VSHLKHDGVYVWVVSALLALQVLLDGGLEVVYLCAGQLQLPAQIVDLLDQRHVLLKSRTQNTG